MVDIFMAISQLISCLILSIRIRGGLDCGGDGGHGIFVFKQAKQTNKNTQQNQTNNKIHASNFFFNYW